MLILEDRAVELQHIISQVIRRERDQNGAELALVDLEENTLTAVTVGVFAGLDDVVLFQKFLDEGGDVGRLEIRQFDQPRAADRLKMIDEVQDQVFPVILVAFCRLHEASVPERGCKTFYICIELYHAEMCSAMKKTEKGPYFLKK